MNASSSAPSIGTVGRAADPVDDFPVATLSDVSIIGRTCSSRQSGGLPLLAAPMDGADQEAELHAAGRVRESVAFDRAAMPDAVRLLQQHGYVHPVERLFCEKVGARCHDGTLHTRIVHDLE